MAQRNFSKETAQVLSKYADSDIASRLLAQVRNGSQERGLWGMEPVAGVVVFDQQLAISHFNANAEVLTGIPAEIILGQHVGTMYADEDERHQIMGVLESVCDGHQWEGEWDHTRHDGKRQRLYLTLAPMLDPEGGVMGSIATLQPRGDVLEVAEQRYGYPEYIVHECNHQISTWYTAKQALKRAETYCHTDSRYLTGEQMRAYLSGMSGVHKASTRAMTIQWVKAYKKYLIKRGIEQDDRGVFDVEEPKVVRQRPKFLGLEECQVLLEGCRTSNQYRLIYLGLYAGLRVSEIASIRAENWTQMGELNRLQLTGKGRKERDVPVHPELAKVKDLILIDQRDSKGQRPSRPTTNSMKQTAVAMSDFLQIRFTPHILRKTWSTMLGEQEVQDSVIDDLGGWAPKGTRAQTYTSISWPRKVRAIAKLNYGVGVHSGAMDR